MLVQNHITNYKKLVKIITIFTYCFVIQIKKKNRRIWWWDLRGKKDALGEEEEDDDAPCRRYRLRHLERNHKLRKCFPGVA